MSNEFDPYCSEPEPFSAFPAVCARLTATRRMAPLLCFDFDEPRGLVSVDTGSDQFVLGFLEGDVEWFCAAHRLGGLLARVLPTSDPDRVALLGNWDNRTSSLSGVPFEQVPGF